MRKYSFAQRGFGMVQAMVLAGVMAAGALVATRIINDLKLTQRGAATRDDLEVLHASVVSALQDSAHCTASMNAAAVTPARVVLGDSTPGNNLDNPILIQKDVTYMGNSVKVTNIAYALGATSGTITVDYARLKSDDANKLGKGYGGQDIRKVLTLNVINDAVQGNRCYLDVNGYNANTSQEFCQGLGTFMVWDAVNKKCNLNQHACPPDTAFIGIDSNGTEICRNLNSRMNASNLFELGNVSCPGRTQLKLVVDPVTDKIKMECIGCTGSPTCATIAATYCASAPTQVDNCGVNCGVGTKSSGCSAILSWSPLTFDFGGVTVGGNSANQTFTLYNTGAASTSGCSAPTLTDTTNFTLTPSGNCVGTADIPAGGNCTVTVRGNPTTAGVKTTTLSRTCTNGGTATTTANQILVNGTTGGCTGSGGYSNGLFTNTAADGGSCASTYRYQYFDVDPAKFKVGNIYSIQRGRAVTEEVLASDTITSMLNRLATKINAGGNFASGGCGAGNYNNATVSGSRITHRVYWQNSAIADGSYSCNITTQATCTATPGCTWDTTSPNICKGWNFAVPQGVCSGTYNQPICLLDGSGSGGDMNCRYNYSTSATCAASGIGCYWGTISQTCYATDSASCTANAGCSWTSYPSNNQSCTSLTDQTSCQSHGATCTWGPP